MRIDDIASPRRSPDELRAEVAVRAESLRRAFRRKVGMIAGAAIAIVLAVAIVGGGVGPVTGVRTFAPATRGGEGDAGDRAESSADDTDAARTPLSTRDGPIAGSGPRDRLDRLTSPDAGTGSNSPARPSPPGAGPPLPAESSETLQFLVSMFNPSRTTELGVDGTDRGQIVRELIPAARWSPAGDQLAILRHDLVVLDPGTGTERTLFRRSEIDRVELPSWTPDGEAILVLRAQGLVSRSPRLWRIDVRSGGMQDVTPPRFVHGAEMNAAGRLLYGCQRDGGGTSLCTAQLGSSEFSVLPGTSVPGQLFDYRWAPDGRTVVFVSEGTDAGMWVTSDGWPDRQLVARRAINPVWFPDGSRIAFKLMPTGEPNAVPGSPESEPCSAWPCPDETGVWSVAIDGSDPRAITREPADLHDVRAL